MKIIITAPSLDFSKNVSGISSVVRNVLEELGTEFNFEHVQLAKTDARRGPTAIAYSVGLLAKALWSVATNANGSILHMNLALNPKSIIRDAAVVWVARIRGFPVLLHVHGGEYLEAEPSQLLRRVVEFHISSAEHILVLSELEVQEFERRYPNSAGKLDYLYNCTAVGNLDRPQRVSRLRVLFAGRFESSKGIDLLLEVAAQGGVEYSIAGQGSRLPEILEACSRYDNCTYLGVLTGEEVRLAMRQHDVLLLPSLSGVGMPMAVVEAMAEGTIPIVTGIASLPVLVSDGETGFIVRSRDAALVQARLLLLSQDSSERDAISKRAHLFARTRLERSVVLRKLASYYARLASR